MFNMFLMCTRGHEAETTAVFVSEHGAERSAFPPEESDEGVKHAT